MAIAFVLGRPTLRLRGAYFAIGTLALAESAKQLALAWDRLTGIPLTGGSAGVSLPLSGSYVIFYYLMLGIMVLVTGTALWLERSKFGYGLRADRRERAARRGLGRGSAAARSCASTCSARSFTAWTGGTQGYWLSYINASEAFGAAITFQMVVMALVGGLGTPFGPLLGAGFLTLASELLGTQFVHHYLIAIGVIIVVICLFLPSGLAGCHGAATARGRRVVVTSWRSEGSASRSGR